ncbi:MAG: GTP 3',8-cyclase MoaA [Sphingobacteriia bacterium]|nr:MAG: GTP 3',8-cyclase MoaA [Sphingobacteriia bacterium]TAH08609.1 MAG: GTP 3',8-cyclase MoaA [Sphingobacteriia bacterium]
MLKDKYNRAHNYLRISLTDNCNLRCFYCMPNEDYAFMPREQMMQKEEIIAFAKIFIALGVTKIRLTGGEPLVRKDAAEIILALGKLKVELTITTNATRVHHFIPDFQAAGIESVNISLDTLQAHKFQLITRRDQFDTVKNNIQILLHHAFKVKINMVVVKGLNEDELLDFIEWTKNIPIHIRFIEFMPFDGNKWNSDKLVTWQQMLQTIGAAYEITEAENSPNDTSKNYQIKGHKGSFAVISTMSAPFCSTCNRIRLTADGKIKNCLFSAGETDLLTAWRKGEDINALIRDTIYAKHKELGGQFSKDFESINTHELNNRSMIAIGG